MIRFIDELLFSRISVFSSWPASLYIPGFSSTASLTWRGLKTALQLMIGLMKLNRRDFIVAPAATLATSFFAAEPAVPWQRKIPI
jgi:hypothetical protein